MRKQFIREQKASVRKQREELRLKTKGGGREMRPGFMKRIGLFFSFLFRNRPLQPSSEHSHKPGKTGLIRDWQEISDDWRSRKREKLQNSERMKLMRRKINKERREYFRLRLIRFLKNPIPGRKLSKDQKYIIELSKRERKKQIRQKIKNYPANFRIHTAQFWKNRWNNLAHSWNSVRIFAREFIKVSRDRVLSRDYLISTLNSLSMFILSFLLVYLTSQVATIITASYYEIPTVLYSYRVYWPLYTYSTLYTRGALIVIFGIGPAISLILAFLFYRIFLLLKHRTRLLRIFFFWATIHGLNFFFGSYIVGVITRTGFIYTSEWLFFSNIFDPEEIMFMIIAFIALIVAGYLATRHVITTADSEIMIIPRFRVFYLLSKVLIPWIIGNLVLFAINLPNNPLELWLLYVMSLLVVLPMFVNYNSPMNLQLKTFEIKKKYRLGWEYVIFAIIALVLFRLGLFNGISYG